MQYSFDVQEAVDYGVPEAIMIWNLRFWIIKNKANNKHFYDGRTWTYNTGEALAKLFPFWSTDQIDRLITKMVDKKIIILGNYNQNSHIRTRWFAFYNEEKLLALHLVIAHSADSRNGNRDFTESILQIRGMEIAKSRNGDCEIAECNTDNKQDIKPDSFFSFPNPKAANREQLQFYKEKKGYKSDVINFYDMNEATGWKNGKKKIENRYAWYDGYENNFKKENSNLYGNYNATEEKKTPQISEETKKRRAEIKNSAATTDILAKIKNNFDENLFERWFKDLKVFDLIDNELILEVSTKFLRDWILREFVENKQGLNLKQILGYKIKIISLEK